MIVNQLAKYFYDKKDKKLSLFFPKELFFFTINDEVRSILFRKAHKIFVAFKHVYQFTVTISGEKVNKDKTAYLMVIFLFTTKQ